PTPTDAMRLGRSHPLGEAWAVGRAASMSLVVERAIVNGRSPDEAAAPFCVSADPHRGRVVAWLATASVGDIVGDFVAAVESLSATGTDWFALGLSEWFTPEATSLSVRETARRNLALVVCTLGRMDVLDGLMGWYGLCDFETLVSCALVAVGRDDVDVFATVICHATHADVRMPHRKTRNGGVECMLQMAMRCAARMGCLCIMQRLFDWSAPDAGGLLSPAGFANGDTRPRARILDDTSIAARARDRVRAAHVEGCWVVPAAVADRVDVFSEALCRGWPRYDDVDVAFVALTNGSLAVEKFETARVGVSDVNGRRIVDRVMWALREVSYAYPSKASFRRGMERLRTRHPEFGTKDAVDLVGRLGSCMDLVECVIDVWPAGIERPAGLPSYTSNAVFWAVSQGHWGVLGRIVKACGMANDDHSRRTGSAPSEPARDFWFDVAVEFPIVRVDYDGSCILDVTKELCTEEALGRLTLLCRMAYLSGCIPAAVAQSHPNADLFADPDEHAVEAEDWLRWCKPSAIAVRPRRSDPLYEADDPGQLALCNSLIALLDDAHLVSGYPADCDTDIQQDDDP
ncbi:MAG TPA: hypothetical protein VIO38_15455, partial [Rariglobus sp.]